MSEFNQMQYQNDYNKQNYDRITIMVPKGEKELIKKAALAHGQSVNAFICDIIKNKLS